MEEGNTVRLTVELRGREKAYPEIGREKLERITRELEDIAKPDKDIELKGNRMMVVLIRK